MLRGAFIFIILCALFSGCGRGGNSAPVSGLVTLNGKPVAGIAVSFQPVVTEGNIAPGPAAFGVTGADGRYVAQLMGETRKGAAIGKNQVRFSVYMPPDDPDTPSKAKPAVQIPARYWSDSKLELDVPAKGTATADFQLTSP